MWFDRHGDGDAFDAAAMLKALCEYGADAVGASLYTHTDNPFYDSVQKERNNAGRMGSQPSG